MRRRISNESSIHSFEFDLDGAMWFRDNSLDILGWDKPKFSMKLFDPYAWSYFRPLFDGSVYKYHSLDLGWSPLYQVKHVYWKSKRKLGILHEEE
jgi:hypothetical protein